MNPLGKPGGGQETSDAWGAQVGCGVYPEMAAKTLAPRGGMTSRLQHRRQQDDLLVFDLGINEMEKKKKKPLRICKSEMALAQVRTLV